MSLHKDDIKTRTLKLERAQNPNKHMLHVGKIIKSKNVRILVSDDKHKNCNYQSKAKRVSFVK